MYKLYKKYGYNEIVSVIRLIDNTSIPFALDNTDYQNFKKQINADEAQLEDADGNLMTDAKAFVSTLP